MCWEGESKVLLGVCWRDVCDDGVVLGGGFLGGYEVMTDGKGHFESIMEGIKGEMALS